MPEIRAGLVLEQDNKRTFNYNLSSSREMCAES